MADSCHERCMRVQSESLSTQYESCHMTDLDLMSASHFSISRSSIQVNMNTCSSDRVISEDIKVDRALNRSERYLILKVAFDTHISHMGYSN